MDEHIRWRRDFHPDAKPVISLREQREADFEATLEQTTDTLLELSSKLKASSMPWFSARYLGHMNSDTLVAANLAYMATILYNPNNCATRVLPPRPHLMLQAVCSQTWHSCRGMGHCAECVCDQVLRTNSVFDQQHDLCRILGQFHEYDAKRTCICGECSGSEANQKLEKSVLQMING